MIKLSLMDFIRMKGYQMKGTVGEITGDLWEYWDNEGRAPHDGDYVVIPTNLTIKNNSVVMDKGLGKEAKRRFYKLPMDLANRYKDNRDQKVFLFKQYRVITLPVRYHYAARSDNGLVEMCLKQLVSLVDSLDIAAGYFWNRRIIYLPHLGYWKDVKPLVFKYLDSRFCIVNPYEPMEIKIKPDTEPVHISRLIKFG